MKLAGRGCDALPGPTTTFDLTAERDAIWATAARWERAGYPWHAAGLRAVTALGKGEL